MYEKSFNFVFLFYFGLSCITCATFISSQQKSNLNHTISKNTKYSMSKHHFSSGRSPHNRGNDPQPKSLCIIWIFIHELEGLLLHLIHWGSKNDHLVIHTLATWSIWSHSVVKDMHSVEPLMNKVRRCDLLQHQSNWKKP